MYMCGQSVSTSPTDWCFCWQSVRIDQVRDSFPSTGCHHSALGHSVRWASWSDSCRYTPLGQHLPWRDIGNSNISWMELLLKFCLKAHTHFCVPSFSCFLHCQTQYCAKEVALKQHEAQSGEHRYIQSECREPCNVHVVALYVHPNRAPWDNYIVP